MARMRTYEEEAEGDQAEHDDHDDSESLHGCGVYVEVQTRCAEVVWSGEDRGGAGRCWCRAVVVVG